MNCEGIDQDLPEVSSLGSMGPDLSFQKAEPFLHENWNIVTVHLGIFGLPTSSIARGSLAWAVGDLGVLEVHLSLMKELSSDLKLGRFEGPI